VPLAGAHHRRRRRHGRHHAGERSRGLLGGKLCGAGFAHTDVHLKHIILNIGPRAYRIGFRTLLERPHNSIGRPHTSKQGNGRVSASSDASVCVCHSDAVRRTRLYLFKVTWIWLFFCFLLRASYRIVPPHSPCRLNSVAVRMDVSCSRHARMLRCSCGCGCGCGSSLAPSAPMMTVELILAVADGCLTSPHTSSTPSVSSCRDAGTPGDTSARGGEGVVCVGGIRAGSPLSLSLSLSLSLRAPVPAAVSNAKLANGKHTTTFPQLFSNFLWGGLY
jgi:hypothetical protein